ncbi:hypothetical protein CERSUDRAFT_73779 [Gelatoporia subvermispora B]|uniref:Uncharacterized protein n=1 Tax=Ceriporiopsis subvermispora (strain B) TaxID=914234 RepID=M2QI60_CERS8|nr:hypothetical protein CERSUDRAFT_73779 [Gelatoporia subvermispora B]
MTNFERSHRSKCSSYTTSTYNLRAIHYSASEYHTVKVPTLIPEFESRDTPRYPVLEAILGSEHQIHECLVTTRDTEGTRHNFLVGYQDRYDFNRAMRRGFPDIPTNAEIVIMSRGKRAFVVDIRSGKPQQAAMIAIRGFLRDIAARRTEARRTRSTAVFPLETTSSRSTLPLRSDCQIGMRECERPHTMFSESQLVYQTQHVRARLRSHDRKMDVPDTFGRSPVGVKRPYLPFAADARHHTKWNYGESWPLTRPHVAWSPYDCGPSRRERADKTTTMRPARHAGTSSPARFGAASARLAATLGSKDLSARGHYSPVNSNPGERAAMSQVLAAMDMSSDSVTADSRELDTDIPMAHTMMPLLRAIATILHEGAKAKMAEERVQHRVQRDLRSLRITIDVQRFMRHLLTFHRSPPGPGICCSLDVGDFIPDFSKPLEDPWNEAMVQKFIDTFVSLPVHECTDADRGIIRDKFSQHFRDLCWDHRLVVMAQASHGD